MAEKYEKFEEAVQSAKDFINKNEYCRFIADNKYYVAGIAALTAGAVLGAIWYDHRSAVTNAHQAVLSIENLMHGVYYPTDFATTNIIAPNIDLSPFQMHDGLSFAQDHLVRSSESGYTGLQPLMDAVAQAQTMGNTQAMKDALSGPQTEIFGKVVGDVHKQSELFGTAVGLGTAGLCSLIYGVSEPRPKEDSRDSRAIA